MTHNPVSGVNRSPGGSPLDRFGRKRCPAYRREDFELCPICPPDESKHDPACPECGGYGEVPVDGKYDDGRC